MKDLHAVVAFLVLANLISHTAMTQRLPKWISPWEQSVVAIGSKDTVEIEGPGGTIIKKLVFYVRGTGVIFYTTVRNVVLPCLVTARHVLYEPERGWRPDSLLLRFSWDQDKPIDDYFGLTVQLKENSRPLWLPHGDSLVDLATIPLLIQRGTTSVDTIPLVPYRDFGDSDDVYVGRTVWVLGYPGSVGVEFWSRAIVREGIVSWTSPSSHGLQRFLVDADVFPGNSGGPVFGVPTGIGKDGNIVHEGSFKFLGIVSQRRFSPAPIKAGRLDVKDRAGQSLHSLESIGIGVVEPSERVHELLSRLHDTLSRTRK